MITSVRVIWLVNEGKKNEEEPRDIYILEARTRERGKKEKEMQWQC